MKKYFNQQLSISASQVWLGENYRIEKKEQVNRISSDGYIPSVVLAVNYRRSKNPVQGIEWHLSYMPSPLYFEWESSGIKDRIFIIPTSQWALGAHFFNRLEFARFDLECLFGVHLNYAAPFGLVYTAYQERQRIFSLHANGINQLFPTGLLNIGYVSKAKYNNRWAAYLSLWGFSYARVSVEYFYPMSTPDKGWAKLNSNYIGLQFQYSWLWKNENI